MALQPGTRLGPYEITAPIGAGGMGEVYSARDTRLDRIVAIKVLPSHLSSNLQLLQRFEREARAVSSLNHPNICTLHDVGEQDGVRYLVMEYLEGETMAQRLDKGALSPDETLRYAIQIADALDKAHRRGVVHRDLKPGNIMLTAGGAKLLDFGLAKSAETGPAGSSLSAAPTGTSPLTAEGTIVGTWQYMAPEQLEGREADARTDIFAFGAVLYEMLTGRKAFEGSTQASLIGAIMRGEPRPPSALTPMTPPALERLVLTCLAKDPDDRRQSIRDVLLDLEWIARGGGGEVAPPAAAQAGRSRLWMASTVALGLVAIVMGWMALVPRAVPGRPITLSFAMPHGIENALHLEQLTLSPDGRSAAFIVSETDGGQSLWIRSLDSAEARSLPGTSGARFPFWSPDSRFLGFFSEGKLRKIDTAGGPPQILCAATDPFGGTWNREGLILFGDGGTRTIEKVAAAGGTPEAVTRLGPTDEGHRWPMFLPDGRHYVLLMDAERTEDHHLGIASLDSMDVTPLFNMISNVIYTEPGYLLFARSGALLAQPFDTDTLEPSGDPVALADNLAQGNYGHRMEFSASDTGMLAYRSVNLDSHITWVDRSGTVLESLGETGRYNNLALSPDGSRVAFGKRDADGRTGDLWVMDLTRNVTSRLTFHPGAVFRPVWSPDGATIAYSSAHEGTTSVVYLKRLDGPGDETPVFSEGTECGSQGFSPDGRELLIQCYADGRLGAWIVPVDDSTQARRLNLSRGDVEDARLSPDGRWISYVSTETGRREVYIQDLQALGRKVLVSTGGGSDPKWRADGREIYYVDNRSRLNAVTLTYGGARGLEASAPSVLFHLRGNSYASAPAADGRRFLVDMPVEDNDAPPYTVVLDWTRLLAER